MPSPVQGTMEATEVDLPATCPWERGRKCDKKKQEGRERGRERKCWGDSRQGDVISWAAGNGGTSWRSPQSPDRV